MVRFWQFFSYHWNIKIFFFSQQLFLMLLLSKDPAGSQPGRSWEGEAASFTEVFFPQQGAATGAPQ